MTKTVFLFISQYSNIIRYLYRTKRSRHYNQALLVFLLYSITSFSPAVSSSDDILAIDIDPENPKIEWMPGEEFDIYTGTMNYEAIDMSLPGNGGLPIEIKRRFIQPREKERTGSAFNNFDRMSLARPFLFARYGIGGYNGCDPQYLVWGLRAQGREEFWSNKKLVMGPFVFSDGNQRIGFYPSARQNSRFTRLYDSSRVPHYVSKDNWYMDCVGSRLIITRPDGVVYTMIRETELYRRAGLSSNFKEALIY